MTDVPNTLVILTPGFPQDETDTTCIPPQQIFVEALKRINPFLNIIVISFQYPFVKKKYIWHNVNVISFAGKNKGGISRVLLWGKIWSRLIKINTQNKLVGVLSFWMGECGLIGGLFAKRYSIRQFTWILGQDARKGNKYFFLAKPRPGSLIALSDFVRETVRSNFGITPAHVIPVGIDVSKYGDLQPGRDIEVLGAGSLIALKRFDRFINITKQLAFRITKIHAVICGDGAEKEKLKAQVADLNLMDNVEMKGEVSHQEVINLMQRSRILLHTSAYEGFGSVCAEALYAGCHVISFSKPMVEKIPHWHIVNSDEEMMKKAWEILNDPAVEYHRVLYKPIEEIARSAMNLFSN